MENSLKINSEEKMNFEKLSAGVRDAKRVSTHGNVTTAIVSFGNFINLIKQGAARSVARKENFTIKKPCITIQTTIRDLYFW